MKYFKYMFERKIYLSGHHPGKTEQKIKIFIQIHNIMFSHM